MGVLLQIAPVSATATKPKKEKGKNRCRMKTLRTNHLPFRVVIDRSGRTTATGYPTRSDAWPSAQVTAMYPR
ncbi:unnamed protein product [Penicillium camemberti]|uniref:Str. FM013 n=1 Tax=Penicillium camemberti (strain FM 013) TaxID=1429867 RepID=A0A0G4PDP9_PENC3|nr:unnamed protein product [Penicillium camemberti]